MSPQQSRCDCSNQILHLLAEVQDRPLLDFEHILQLGARFAKQCERITSCPSCLATGQSLVAIQPLVARVLALFEAACSTYTVGSPSGSSMSSRRSSNSGSSSPGSQRRLDQQVRAMSRQSSAFGQENIACVPSKMSWGNAEFDSEDSQLLAKVLMTRRLMVLGQKLEELREMLHRIWGADWTKQTDVLRSCEASLCFALQKLSTLVGQLKGR